MGEDVPNRRLELRLGPRCLIVPQVASTVSLQREPYQRTLPRVDPGARHSSENRAPMAMPDVPEPDAGNSMDSTDTAAVLSILYRRCNDRLLRIAHLYESDGDAASDLVQGVYLKLLLRPPNLGTTAEWEAWLLRVARNSFIDHARRDSVERRRRQEFASGAADGALGVAQHEIVERALARDDVSDRVLDAVAALPPRQRAVVIARWLQGQSTAEAAKELDMAPGTVRATLFHARTVLRVCLTRP